MEENQKVEREEHEAHKSSVTNAWTFPRGEERSNIDCSVRK